MPNSLFYNISRCDGRSFLFVDCPQLQPHPSNLFFVHGHPSTASPFHHSKLRHKDNRHAAINIIVALAHGDQFIIPARLKLLIHQASLGAQCDWFLFDNQQRTLHTRRRSRHNNSVDSILLSRRCAATAVSSRLT